LNLCCPISLDESREHRQRQQPQLEQHHTNPNSSARGNLLLSLDGAPNPTQALIAALQRRDSGRPRGEGLSKDEDFWLSIKDADGVAVSRFITI
jgi:hypothetical protein